MKNKAEEFYNHPTLWGNPAWDKSKPLTFTKSEMFDFATQFAENENKKLIEKIEDLEEQLNDDGEIPFVDLPGKITKYKLTKIKKK